MARRRMLDPNIWESEDYAQLSVLARLVFIGMISNADDEGRGRANIVYLKSKVFPYDEMISASDIDKALDEIAGTLSVVFYRAGGCDYYAMCNWEKWQRVDKPQPSKIPAYDARSCERQRSAPLGDEINAAFVVSDRTVPESFGNESGDILGSIPPKRKEEKEKRKEREEERAVCAQAISSLNEKAGTNFRCDGAQSLALICARLKEGYTSADFQTVIEKKCAEWKGSEMQKYLRPETLFGAKFEGYLNQEEGGKTSPGTSASSGISANTSNKRKTMDYAHDYDLKAVEKALFDG